MIIMTIKLIIITIIIIEFATAIIFGTGINEKIKDLIIKSEGKEVRVNYFNNSIIQIPECNNFISNVPFSILCKYYVSNRGVVYRWTKEHRILKKHFENV